MTVLTVGLMPAVSLDDIATQNYKERKEKMLHQCAGIFTATTFPFTQISPPADRVEVTTTFRPMTSWTLALTSRGTPRGVGFR